MVIQKDNGQFIYLTKNEVERICLFKQRDEDIRKLTGGIARMIDEEELPPLSEICVDKLAHISADDFREDLDGAFSETEEETVKTYATLYWPEIAGNAVRGSYGLTNTGSVNIYFAEGDVVWAGINNEFPTKCAVEYDECGNPYFRFYEMQIPLAEVQRIGAGL